MEKNTSISDAEKSARARAHSTIGEILDSEKDGDGYIWGDAGLDGWGLHIIRSAELNGLIDPEFANSASNMFGAASVEQEKNFELAKLEQGSLSANAMENFAKAANEFSRYDRAKLAVPEDVKARFLETLKEYKQENSRFKDFQKYEAAHAKPDDVELER